MSFLGTAIVVSVVCQLLVSFKGSISQIKVPLLWSATPSSTTYYYYYSLYIPSHSGQFLPKSTIFAYKFYNFWFVVFLLCTLRAFFHKKYPNYEIIGFQTLLFCLWKINTLCVSSQKKNFFWWGLIEFFWSGKLTIVYYLH